MPVNLKAPKFIKVNDLINILIVE